MRPIVYQTRNIILWHLRKLLLEDAFQPGEDNKTIAGAIVVYHAKLYLAPAFF
jgi:hypothetical protein